MMIGGSREPTGAISVKSYDINHGQGQGLIFGYAGESTYLERYKNMKDTLTWPIPAELGPAEFFSRLVSKLDLSTRQVVLHQQSIVLNVDENGSDSQLKAVDLAWLKQHNTTVAKDYEVVDLVDANTNQTIIWQQPLDDGWPFEGGIVNRDRNLADRDIDAILSSTGKPATVTYSERLAHLIIGKLRA